MSQKTQTTPLKFKCPNGIDYSPTQNVDRYNFQLRYSPLVNHTEKNPGNLCYINSEKNFGEVSGCSDEPSLMNYSTPTIINKISNDGFSKNIFKYDKNYVSQPPFSNLENLERMQDLTKVSLYSGADLYKNYCDKNFNDSFSLNKINK
tara:strand:- start:48 stop:491 length:444 start_codon:yes stop_codon:yes gene_type:complete